MPDIHQPLTLFSLIEDAEIVHRALMEQEDRFTISFIRERRSGRRNDSAVATAPKDSAS